MHESTQSIAMQRAWNGVSNAFNDGRIPLANAIDYGVFCPLDDELNLVGEVTGLNVLDIGCGGGQNAIRFAYLGAKVTALDFSERQLDYAKKNCAGEEIDLRFILGDAKLLAGIPDASQDLVFCANVYPYVENIALALASCRRVLKPKGRLIASMDHPIRSCFQELDSNEMTNYAERSYFSSTPRDWQFADTAIRMQSFDRTIGQWTGLLREAGLALYSILEPPAPIEILNDYFPEDGPLSSLRNIPHTLIFDARATTD